MTRSTSTLLACLCVGAIGVAATAQAADYALAGGTVKFSAPDAWPMLIEKLDGPRQFVALQVKTPDDAKALARITVTTEQVDGVQGFQKFINDGSAHARKLPGYAAKETAGASSSMQYSASENGEKFAYDEIYVYHPNLAVQVRCVRPATAAAAWSATFDAGCRSIATAAQR